MQSNMVSPAGLPRAIPRKHFDMSGKSAAPFHLHTIGRTPMALPGNGLFGAIEGKNRSGSWSYAEAAEFRKRRGFMRSKDDPQFLFRSVADIAASIPDMVELWRRSPA